jgi:hypothetical protein
MISCPGCNVRFAVAKDAAPSHTLFVPAPAGKPLPVRPDLPPRPHKPKPGEPTITYRCKACGHLGETGIDNRGLAFTCPGCGDRVEMPDLASVDPADGFTAQPPARVPLLEPATFEPTQPLPKPKGPTVTFVCGACGYYGQSPIHNAGMTLPCSKCGAPLTIPHAPLAAAAPRANFTPQRASTPWGIGILAAIFFFGGLLFLFAGLGMDTTVATHTNGAFGLPDRVHNIGLMQERQMLVLLGGGSTFLGVILAVAFEMMRRK